MELITLYGRVWDNTHILSYHLWYVANMPVLPVNSVGWFLLLCGANNYLTFVNFIEDHT